MIRTSLTLMLCLSGLLAMACDEAEPAADTGQPADAVLESVQQDSTGAPTLPTDATAPAGRERDPEQLRTTQPVQRPVQSPENP